MADVTTNYGFATGLRTDDFVEAEHQNRLADSVDRIVGSVLRRLFGSGVHTGWLIGNDKTVNAGEGLLSGCWCGTAVAQTIEGLMSGYTNHVYAETTQDSAPSGTVRFFARQAPLVVDGEAYLGTVALDGGGAVVSIDNAPPGSTRNCWRLALRKLEGTGSVTGIPGGGVVVVAIDHSSQGVFRVPGALSFADAAGGFEYEPVDASGGGRFRVRVVNTAASARDLSFSWTRQGFVE